MRHANKMTKSLIKSGLLSISLLGFLVSSGCGPKAEITPDKKAQFGTANQPMPAGVAEKIRAATEKAQQNRGSGSSAK